MPVKLALLFLIGISGAGFVAAGTFAFITMLGIVPRLAGRTATAKYILLYENLIIVGGALGNIISILDLRVSEQSVFYGNGWTLMIPGFFWGIFVGCLAMALAEVLQVFPIFAKRVKLLTGMPIIVISIAAGKLFGALMQIWFGWK